MDFTPQSYKSLLLALKNAGYSFLTFEAYCNLQQSETPTKFIILRHDVDLRADLSLAAAKIEYELSAVASYYFRTLPQSNNPEIIRQIASLGHEIGYHYEDMSLCNAEPDRAVEHFTKQLAYFRTYYPVKTVCMHGAPTSKYDSKDIWQFTSLQDHNLIGEPYNSIDYNRLFYITDTGRRWDGFRTSLRDKIPAHQDRWTASGLTYHTTADIIRAINKGTFPHQLMMTTHPQRWTDNTLHWCKELISQRLKNIIKRIIILSKYNSSLLN